MPVAAEASPRSTEEYEKWFAGQRERFYRRELKDLIFAADIFHFYRDYNDGEAGIKVIRRYGKDHKIHRLSLRLSPEDIAASQNTTPEINDDHKKLLDSISGSEGIDVTIDLRKVTKTEPLGFTLELSPAGEEDKGLVTNLINTGIVYDWESKGGEELNAEKIMSLYTPLSHGRIVDCNINSWAHQNPELAGFLKTTAFWMQKVISRRHTPTNQI